MEWIIENKEWIFSGIGVSAILVFGGIIFKKKRIDDSNIQQKQKSGKNSINIQIGKIENTKDRK